MAWFTFVYLSFRAQNFTLAEFLFAQGEGGTRRGSGV